MEMLNRFQEDKVGKSNSLFFLGLLLAMLVVWGCSEGKDDTNGSAEPAGSGLDSRPNNPTCLAADRPSTGVEIGLSRVFAALQLRVPVVMIEAPHRDGLFYVVEQSGTVKVFESANPAASLKTFIDIGDRVFYGGERGLLGMAFHPRFPDDLRVFLSYTGRGEGSQLTSFISAFTASANGLALDGSSEEVILSVPQPYGNHNGGQIVFGRDGYLYIGLGDGGSGGDPLDNAQNPQSLLGKMLRIDIDGGTPYAIPPTNPFVNGGGRPEIYALGLRNPWRWSFDGATGELWAGDVGQNRWEEIDRIVLGGNYGWNIKEGFHCYKIDPCEPGGLIDPVVEYPHSEGCSVTGGYVYRGNSIPLLAGIYIYGDYCNGNIRGIFYDDEGNPYSRLLIASGLSISSFAERNDGELYVLRYDKGAVYKLVSKSQGVSDGVPQKLSETGCVNPQNPRQICDCIIPYDVNVSFWSDGAIKGRFLAIPDGEAIRVEENGHLELPIGSVLMKQFMVGGKLVETRLLVRHQDGGWAGYSYEWDEFQGEATLLAAGKVKSVKGQDWIYPSRAQCLQCHTAVAGRTLGLEIAQLNRLLTYPSTNRRANQLSTLNHIGLLQPPLSESPDNLPALPALDDDSQPLDLRARAYLHVNCSNCHRPGGSGRGNMDLRYQVAEEEMQICDVPPELGDLGINGARLLAPQAPQRSIILVRMQALDFSRMPPIGSNLLDDSGIALIREWILSIANCNR
jgi:uncharacterized repeat protein (TIGR03806 family)